MEHGFQDAGSELLNDRAQHLLKALVQHFIQEGQPVGSRVLARSADMQLSSATVRNVIADLEELGYVRSPHTSAGRVPTVKGYRFFVDALLTQSLRDDRAVQRLSPMFKPEDDVPGLIRSASDLLSGITQLAGLVMVPRRDHESLRRVDFLPLSDRRVLMILVLNQHEVENRVVEVTRDYTSDELQIAANFLNRHFAGRSLAAIRAALLDDLRETRRDMNEAAEAAVDIARQAFSEPTQDEDFVVAGETKLMDVEDLAGRVDRLRELFEALQEKRDILHLLDQCLRADGVKIFIGEESGYRALDEYSVVTAPYTANGEVLGVLGVIGPTRMAYDRVIPVVDATAKLLGAALNFRTQAPDQD